VTSVDIDKKLNRPGTGRNSPTPRNEPCRPAV
jgi:hypothetical protein